MYRFRKIDFDVTKKFPNLNGVFEGHKEVVLAYLFGSYGRGKTSPLSDVDIAYLTNSNRGRSFQEEMHLSGEVMEALGTEEVDVVNLGKAYSVFRYKVISEGKLIFCRDRKIKENFEARAIMEFLDFKPIRDRYFKEMSKHIKEERHGRR